MHRFTRVPRSTLAIAFLGLTALLSLGSSRAGAQEKVVEKAQERPAVVAVPIGGSQILEMSKKQRIKDIDNKDQNVAHVDFVQGSDFRRVMIVAGGTSGVTRLVLTDTDGNREVFDVVVEVNVEFLKRVLAQAVPTANIQILGGVAGTIILTGTVTEAGHIDVIMRTAVSTVGDPNKVINAIRIGGVQQVQLDVVIARVARSEARSMGFNFIENGNNHYVSSIIDVPGSIASTLTNSVGNVASSLSGAPNIAFGIFNGSQGFLGFLTALRTESLVKILAQPSVCTVSGKPAFFLSGGKQAVPTLASGGAGGGAVSGIDFVPFGTTISFMPLVLGNGKIYLEVQPAFDFPDPTSLFSSPIPGTSGSVFGRTTETVQTAAYLEDGQTLVIGGMIFHQVNGTATKVPVLGDIPYIGAAFSAINYTDSEEELVIMITPHLVDAMSCDQVKCLPGQETRKPDDFELFLERILEAPRGPRQAWQGCTYVPAYKNSPTAGLLPCTNCGGSHGVCDLAVPAGPACPPCGGCQTGGCGAIPGGCGGIPWNGSIPVGTSPLGMQPVTPCQAAVTVSTQQLPVSGTQPQAKVGFAPVQAVPVDTLPPAAPAAPTLPLDIPSGTSGLTLGAPATTGLEPR